MRAREIKRNKLKPQAARKAIPSIIVAHNPLLGRVKADPQIILAAPLYNWNMT